MSTSDKRPLKVFLCHIIPLWDAHTPSGPGADTLTGTGRDRVHALDGRVGGGFRYGLRPTQPPPPYRDHERLTNDGVELVEVPKHPPRPGLGVIIQT